jgi:hypothetical protein
MKDYCTDIDCFMFEEKESEEKKLSSWLRKCVFSIYKQLF